MAKFIPVEPEKWAEMVQALAENARLKAEVERLTHLANQSEFYRSQLQKDTCRLENIQMQDAFKHYEAENARLKAEVEELTHDANEADQQYEHAISRVRRLEAEVERLRKAGDELLREWSSGDETEGRNFKKGLVLWNAAKEGKQP